MGPRRVHRTDEPAGGGNADPKRPYPGARKAARNNVSFEEVDAARLCRLLQVLASQHSALLLGITSDGGAFALTFLLGNVREKRYTETAEGFDSLVQEWLDYLEGA
jgi:hypothetical protein